MLSVVARIGLLMMLTVTTSCKAMSLILAMVGASVTTVVVSKAIDFCMKSSIRDIEAEQISGDTIVRIQLLEDVNRLEDELGIARTTNASMTKLAKRKLELTALVETQRKVAILERQMEILGERLGQPLDDGQGNTVSIAQVLMYLSGVHQQRMSSDMSVSASSLSPAEEAICTRNNYLLQQFYGTTDHNEMFLKLAVLFALQPLSDGMVNSKILNQLKMQEVPKPIRIYPGGGPKITALEDRVKMLEDQMRAESPGASSSTTSTSALAAYA